MRKFLFAVFTVLGFSVLVATGGGFISTSVSPTDSLLASNQHNPGGG